MRRMALSFARVTSVNDCVFTRSERRAVAELGVIVLPDHAIDHDTVESLSFIVTCNALHGDFSSIWQV